MDKERIAKEAGFRNENERRLERVRSNVWQDWMQKHMTDEGKYSDAEVISEMRMEGR